MPSLTVENYLKAILQFTLRSGAKLMSTGELATAMQVSPGTVTSMLKTLSDGGLADYRPYEGVALTSSGRKLAMRMLRRHRLLELFLVETLKLSWDQVHEEAEDMEHAVSDFLIDRIDDFLGRPHFDPHGDPIPSPEGEMRGAKRKAVPLSQCAEGTHFRLVRVTDQQPEFLRYLSETGLEIDVEGNVVQRSQSAGILTIEVGSGSISLGLTAAEVLLVEILSI